MVNCSQTYDLEENLKTHVQVVHLGQRLKCDKCDYATSNKRCFVAHIKCKHENVNIKPFKKQSCVSSMLFPWMYNATT